MQQYRLECMTLFRAALVLATAGLNGCVTLSRIEPPVAPPPSTQDEVRVIADLVNDHRRRVGCKPLVWMSVVAAVAQRHSENMANHGFFSHTDHRGKDPFDRLTDAGIVYRSAAENIAYGQQSAEQVLHSWLSSSGHRRNIEDCGFAQHGIGLANTRWTHVFVNMR